MRSRQETPRMDRRQRKWKALSLFSGCQYIAQVSQSYSSMQATQMRILTYAALPKLESEVLQT